MHILPNSDPLVRSRRPFNSVAGSELTVGNIAKIADSLAESRDTMAKLAADLAAKIADLSGPDRQRRNRNQSANQGRRSRRHDQTTSGAAPVTRCTIRRPAPNNAPFAALIAALEANDEKRAVDEATKVARRVIATKPKKPPGNHATKRCKPCHTSR